MPIGMDTVNGAAGAVNDLFSAIGDRYKAQGAEFEKERYLSAAEMSDKNAQYTAMSTAIKAAQFERQLYQSMSKTTADVAGAGLASSGTALDILADSASQGALTKQVMAEQGLITEEGYKEQAKSYRLMADAAQTAKEGYEVAGIGSMITSAIKGGAALAMFAL